MEETIMTQFGNDGADNPTMEELFFFNDEFENDEFENDELRIDELNIGELEQLEEDIESANEEDIESLFQADSVDAADIDGFRLYLRNIGNIPLLTADEEKEYGKIIREGGAGAKEARNRLVESNLKLAVHFAKKNIGRGVDIEDLNTMGIEGLIRAAEKFDYTKGFRFSTYASWWIKQAINRGIAEQGTTVRIAVHMGETIRKVKKAQDAILQETHRDATVSEIAERANLTEEKVMTAIESMYTTVSMDMKVGEDGDTALEDFLKDTNAIDPCENALQKGLVEAIGRVLGQLPPKEALVLKFRFGLGGVEAKTLEEIANLPGFMVTRERIRQIENKALRRIRHNYALKKELMDFAS